MSRVISKEIRVISTKKGIYKTLLDTSPDPPNRVTCHPSPQNLIPTIEGQRSISREELLYSSNESPESFFGTDIRTTVARFCVAVR